LLVIYALFEILLNTLIFFYLTTSTTGINFLPNWLSKIYIFYVIIVFNTSNFMLLLISIDRLVGVTLPIL